MLNLLPVGFLVLVALLVAGGAAYVWHNTREAAAAADQWFALLQQGRFEEAYALTMPAFQQSTSLQALRERVELSGLIHAVPPVWSDREVAKGLATLAGGIPGQESPSPVAVQLRRYGDIWYVYGVVVSPLIGRQMRRLMTIRVDEPGFQIDTPNPGTPTGSQ